MIDHFFIRPCTITRLQAGPCGPYLNALAKTLHQQGYACDSIRRTLYAGDKFGRWLAQHGYSVADADEATVERYTSGLKRPPSGTQPKAAQGLSHLVELLRQRGIVAKPEAPEPSTEVDHWLVRYETYLERVVGTAAHTRQRYLALVRRFLVSRFGAGAVTWKVITGYEVGEFVRQEAANKQGFGRKVPAVAIRSLLRFLVFCGELRPGLEAAVAMPRQWQHAALPKPLDAEQIAQVLATCPQGTPKRLRDRAILLLLARLGLRAGEVAQLRLDDIDWHTSQLLDSTGQNSPGEMFTPVARSW